MGASSAPSFELIQAACETATKEDRSPLTSSAVLEAYCGIPGVSDRKRAETLLLGAAQKCRFKTEMRSLLQAVYTEFIQKKRGEHANSTEFSDLPEGGGAQLKCGSFEANDQGIQYTEYVGKEMKPVTIRVCAHPLLPIAYLENAQDGYQRVMLAFRKNDAWKTIIADRSDLADRRNIVKLSAYGIDVTTETGRYLVQYFADIEAQNEGRIPRKKSIGRMGWYGQEFAPYMQGIVFDGDVQFADLFRDLRPQGDFQVWKEHVSALRRAGGPARLLLAASLAAPIVGMLDGLTFLVHLWGTTGRGKTVSLMAAASVWGNPALGQLVRSFSSTAVGMEMLAGFLRHMPVCLDELQTAQYKKNFDDTIYMLGEGQGKTRGKSGGGLRATEQWKTVALTSGEQPISSERSGGGAKNRVIEVECAGELLENAVQTAAIVKGHYGHAGQMMIHALQGLGRDAVQEMYRKADADIRDARKVTDKQRQAAAYLLVADRIATEHIFQDDCALSPYTLAEALECEQAVQTFPRAMDHVKAWITQNPDRFISDRNDPRPGEVWGRWLVENWEIAVLSPVLEEMLTNAGFSYKAFLADAEQYGRLQRSADGKRTKMTRILKGGDAVRCVILNLEQKETENALLQEVMDMVL